MEFRLTVVICTHKRLDLLRRTLDSLALCSLPESFQGVFVVENGGEFGADQVVAEAAACLKARYLYHPRSSKSEAQNVALNTIRQGLIVFIDDDLQVDRDFIEAYHQGAAAWTRGAFFGGPVIPEYEVEPPAWLIPFLPPSAKGLVWEKDPHQLAHSLFVGSNFAVFAEDLIEVGGFDPQLGVGSRSNCTGEESDVQNRLVRNGICGEYLSAAAVRHHVPASRCTPRWTLGRKYRSGIYQGLTDRDRVAKIAGFPRWYFRALAISSLKYLMTRLHSSRARRFQASVDFYRAWGRLRGCHLQLREGPTLKGALAETDTASSPAELDLG